ncbi:hypothetical protein ACVWZR_001797 [Bradyrhizobium sp. i1.3.1]
MKAMLIAIAGTMPNLSVILPAITPAKAETEHHQCEGQRHSCSRGGELGLHDGNHHDDRPHADATDRTDQQRKQQPHPSLTRIRGE